MKVLKVLIVAGMLSPWTPVSANQTRLNELEEAIKIQRLLLEEQGSKIKTLEQQLGRVSEDANAIKLDLSENKNILRGPENPYKKLADDEFPRSIPLVGSDWRFSFGGYLKADAIADFGGTGDKNSFVVATIPVEGASNSPQPGSYTNFHARETRFNFEMRNVNKELPFTKAFIEMDFFDETSTSARLRHAYFQYGNLIVGQTWTTLTEMRALPFLVDFAYGDALFGNRTVQMRWEQPVSEQFSWAVALENWNDSAIANPNSLSGTARSQLPMLAGRGTYNFGQGIVTLGGSLAQLRWDGDAGISNDSVLHWAGVLGSRIYIDRNKKHYIGLSGSYGQASAPSIISLLEGNVPGAVLKADGSLVPLHAWNAMFSFHYKWSKRFSSNFGCAWSAVEHSELRDPDDMQAGGASHINLICDISRPLRVGIEYMIGSRKNVNGNDGQSNRLQFMTMYSF